jgi:circularin A/uberolysin family circular bacteriocin
MVRPWSDMSTEEESLMNHNPTTPRRAVTAVVATAVAVAGLASAAVGVLWVAGTLGISTAAASQIVRAIEVGGWALTVVLAVFGAGVIGAITATVRAIVARLGTAVAVA